MDWRPIPDQNFHVTLEFSFGEDGITGGWLDGPVRRCMRLPQMCRMLLRPSMLPSPP